MIRTSPKPLKSTLILFPSWPERSRNWPELPEELTAMILVRLGTVDMISARKVCKTWHRICSDPAMWRVVALAPCGYAYHINLTSVARKAVDLSCGQLIDISISNFGSDYLLQYISDRSSQLRRLHLSSCHGMTSKGLSEMLKKLPMLEELHLEYMPISKQTIEVAGLCCPRLKSFKLHSHGSSCPYFGHDNDALAIAENLHGLRHLQLLNRSITNNGLLAIIENCSHLESLDIRKCFGIGSDLRSRLFQQIKDLRLSNDSTEDHGSDGSLYSCDCCDYYPEPFEYAEMFHDEFYHGGDIDSD